MRGPFSPNAITGIPNRFANPARKLRAVIMPNVSRPGDKGGKGNPVTAIDLLRNAGT